MADPRKEVRLDPALQAKLLEQMQEEQAAALQKRALRNWLLLPTAFVCAAIGVANMFSDDLMIAFIANTVATGIVWTLWRVNRDWIRNTFGF